MTDNAHADDPPKYEPIRQCSGCDEWGGSWLAFDPSTESIRCCNCVGLSRNEAMMSSAEAWNAIGKVIGKAKVTP